MTPTTSPRRGSRPALTADAMRSADEYTIDEYGIPSFTLMESAGRGASAVIRDEYGPLQGKTVIILCGKGNNGGDGLVVARCLHAMGAAVRVILTSPPSDLREDPARNLKLLESLVSEEGGERLSIRSVDGLEPLTTMADRLDPDLYVDAMLGTGLTSDVREPVSNLVQWVNSRRASVVAIDVPTGLHSDTGAVLGTAVNAQYTVTMAAPKVGLLVGDGPSCSGTVEVVDIGIPPFVLDQVAEAPGCARQTDDAATREWWPERTRDAYKYSVGTAMVVGGSARFVGAPTLASRAAERSGAGYVTCACPASVQSRVSSRLSTVPTVPLPEKGDDGIALTAVDRIQEERADALLVGPGLGRAPQTQRFVYRLLKETDCPLVIDADGLNALADLDEDWTAHARPNWILTPHAGEFARLADEPDLADRVRTVQAHAEEWGVVLLLKGNPSIVANPEGRTYVGSTGTSALATAGTGDVLAGQCVGLLSQGVPAVEAAAAALHLGGAAAQEYAHRHDPRTMVATDLLELLPQVTHDRLSDNRSPQP